MSILERFSTIIKANINDLLDRAEDPAKMMDQYMRQLMSDLADVKRETASVMAEESRIQRQLEEKRQESAKNADLARRALQLSNEDDARVFLAKKQELEKRIEELQKMYDVAHENSMRMRQVHDKLVSDAETLRQRREAIQSKMALARAQEKAANVMGSHIGADESRLGDAIARMEDKADWAYAELRALLEYSVANGVDPFEIPGSGYGAVGLCQFMPSNLPRYAVDGDGDGIIDLFAPADAVASLSNYLARHGWKKDMSIPEQIKVLRRYNNLAVYANTILALAEKIREIPGRPTVNRPLPQPPTMISEN